jgi:hypothetical protein
MLTIDCPLCAEIATTDVALTSVRCDTCGVTVEVAADPAPVALDVAA